MKTSHTWQRRTDGINSYYFFTDVVEMYGETYLTSWLTAEELDEVERCYERKGFLGCVGEIDCY